MLGEILNFICEFVGLPLTAFLLLALIVVIVIKE